MSHLDSNVINKAEKRSLSDLLRLIEIEMDWGDLAGLITPELSAEGMGAMRRFLLKIGVTEAKDPELWKKVSKQVEQMARDRAAELVGKRVQADGTLVDNPNAEWAITETTRDNLHGMVNQAVDEGWTTQQLQHKIIESEDFSSSRALMIARTEKAYAAAHGEHQAAKDTGFKFKEWQTAGETCDECEANEEQGRIGIDDAFQSGDDCPPAHPNCRCSAGYYEADDDEEGD